MSLALEIVRHEFSFGSIALRASAKTPTHSRLLNVSAAMLYMSRVDAPSVFSS